MIKVVLVRFCLGLALSLSALLLTLWPIEASFHFKPNCQQAESKVQQRPALAVPAPDLRMLLEQSMSGAVNTDQQLEEQRAVEAEQVELAGQWLNDADAAQRVIGAEQLSAYPTPQAEHFLLTALKDDAEDQVRAAAASSLSAFKQPSGKVFDSLLLALHDIDDEVRFNAWSSLQLLLHNPELPTKTVNKVHQKLRQLLKQAKLTLEQREVIGEYLRDQLG